MAGTTGRLTTHVLDTAAGQPAAGIRIELFRLSDGSTDLLKTVTTNDDGRCDVPLLQGAELASGVYELVFHAGAYLDGETGPAEGPRFLDQVPIRFRVADTEAHYHVPLLLSPYAYSTYRGS